MTALSRSLSVMARAMSASIDAMREQRAWRIGRLRRDIAALDREADAAEAHARELRERASDLYAQLWALEPDLDTLSE